MKKVTASRDGKSKVGSGKFNFWKKNYLACWDFAKECKWFFAVGLGIFCLTFLVGFIHPFFFREEIVEMLRKLMVMLDGKSTFYLVGYIFFNNLKASFFAFVLGIGLGVVPAFTCVVNGYLVGFVTRHSVQAEGIWVIWKILPHGVFELPAVMFSIGMGLRLGSQVLTVRSGKKEVGRVFREGLRFFVFVVLPLLVLAAVIEGVLIGFAN